MRTRRAVLAWRRLSVGGAALLAVAVGIGFLASPARAQGGSVSASAFGIASPSASSGPLAAPVPGGVSGAASDPSAGFGPLVASAQLIALPGVLTVDDVEASASGVLSPATQGRLATAAASVDGLALAAGLVKAAHLSSTCTSNKDGSSGSAFLDGLTIGGAAVGVSPAANTEVDIPGVLRAVLNEQTVDDAPGSTAIVVRALDLQVLPDNHGRAFLELIAAESRCGTMGSSAGGTPARPPVSLGPGLPFTKPLLPTFPSTFPSTPGGGPALPVPGAVTPAVPSGTATPAPSPTQSVPPGPPPQAGPGSGSALPATSFAPVVTPPQGPPGAQIRVVASGYGSCQEVGVSFNGVRIGSARPDAGGGIDAAGLAIPGNTPPGRHSVDVACLTSARGGQQSAGFDVTRASVHRSAFATSVPLPGQVSTRLRTVLSSLLLTTGLVLLIVFPCELFNSTLDENYDEVRSWFGLGPRSSEGVRPLHQALALTGFIIVGGVLYALLSPDFGPNRTTLALALGLSISLALITFVFRLPFLFHSRTRHGEWARLKVLPGTAVVAIVCVGISRLLHFVPGYLYGLIAGLEFRQEPEDTTGRLTSLAALTVLIIGLATWAARAPVAAAAGREGAGFWIVAADACLATIFVIGLETLALTLIPLRFLEGAKVTRWNRVVWVALFASALFAFVHILLQPSSGYVGHTQSGQKWVVVALFVGFGIFSIAFWAYFRFRPARTLERTAVGGGSR